MPKVRLRVSWTEVIPRTTDVVVDISKEDLDDLDAGYGYGDERWADAVREVEGDVDMLHDETDWVEVLARRVRSKK